MLQSISNPKGRTVGFAHAEQIRWRYRNGCSISILARDYGLSEHAVEAHCRGAEKVGYFEVMMRKGIKEAAPTARKGRPHTLPKDRSDE